MKDFSRKYLALLTGEFGTINLTRILDEDEFYSKQIEDSVLPLQVSTLFSELVRSEMIVLDIGFGGGFPVLPIAKVIPDREFIGFEARAKKVAVVSQIAARLEISNVRLFHRRIEDVIIDVPTVLTLKAVTQIDKILPLLKYSACVYVVFYKGPSFEQQESLSAVSGDWDLVERVKYKISQGDERELIIFKAKNVPRGTSKKDKDIVKLSEII